MIFVMNFLLGIVCWAVVRHAARNVREFALERIDRAKSSVKSSYSNTIQINGINVSKKEYLDNLESLRQAIMSEDRGAYARAFQDPSYLGVCIPSGISGIISLMTWWINK
jgi:hypothetical protein